MFITSIRQRAVFECVYLVKERRKEQKSAKAYNYVCGIFLTERRAIKKNKTKKYLQRISHYCRF